MSSITFDKIHTKTKQEQLQTMMQQSASTCHSLKNTNPILEQCTVCKSKDIHFYVEKFGFNLDRCASCHQIFCNPMPSSEQLNSYYNGPMKEFENQFFADSFENRIPIFNYRIEVILQYLGKGKLLDIGSAIGIFVEALTRVKTDLDIHCCDPSVDACNRLRERFPNITLYNNWLNELAEENEYDAVTLWDTLEHIDKLDDFTKKVFSLLKPGGYWFFSTPNTSSFEWEIAGNQHMQLLPPGHINLFNTTSVELLLKNHGFEMVDIQTPNGTLDVSYIDKLTKETLKYDCNLGLFLKQHLSDDTFRAGFADLISTTNTAGNVLVTARKPLKQ